MQDLVAARASVHLQVKDSLAKTTSAMAKSANLHCRDVEFLPGQLVWLKTDHLQLAGSLSRKLAVKWAGPYKILEAVNPVAMKLDLPKAIKLHPVVHVSMLKHH